MPTHPLSDARAEDILGQVRRQLRSEELFLGRQGGARIYSGTPPRAWKAGVTPPGAMSDLEEMAAQLKALHAYLDEEFAADASGIGAMPPVAPTLRGRIGRFAIQVLQRLLYWHTDSVQRFAQSVGVQLHGTTEAMGMLTWMVRSNQKEIAALREEIRVLREWQVRREKEPL